MTQGGLGNYSFSINKRQEEDLGGGVCPRKVPQGLVVTGCSKIL